jgi:hypothetical protein
MYPTLIRLMSNWPKLVFAVIPITVVLGAGAVLTYEHFQSFESKAIRLVKESNSRKENFTIQQYLYTTVYYRRDRGESIVIDGWHARPLEDATLMKIDFTYTDSVGEHTATWLADLKRNIVTPENETARDLSWH